jgi:hypothetical protein
VVQIIPYYPMMSRIVLQIRGYNTEITSNFAAENYFDKLKTREKQFKVPLPLFLVKQAEIVERKALGFA